MELTSLLPKKVADDLQADFYFAKPHHPRIAPERKTLLTMVGGRILELSASSMSTTRSNQLS